MIEGLISKELNIAQRQIAATIELFEQGATVPFISRYRKEVTGNLDEVQIAGIKDLLERYREMEKRKTTILQTIEEQGKLTVELRSRIEGGWVANELEDIYLPYKPKRQTKAEVARKKGLEPLALLIFEQRGDVNVTKVAEKYINEQVANVDDAIKGAQDIIAEMINENEDARNIVRGSFRSTAMITSKIVKGKEEQGDKYRDLFDYSVRLNRCPSHRLLALRRAEEEGILKVDISPDADGCLERMERRFAGRRNDSADLVYDAMTDGYKRLLKPSIETEFASESKERADAEAIEVFTANLRQLLMSAPLGQRRVMGVDPGYRTGCKIVCLNEQGALLINDTIYPHQPQNDKAGATRKITDLIRKWNVQAIAIGNGTASRETEAFFKEILAGSNIEIFVVSENGASIYSASEVAREEFPDYDVTVRGAVSIGRRLADPLAELVKIDPKSLGVGQYQHDVNQKSLKKALDEVVESCVNRVGVDVNTASKHLLKYVSGIGDTLAKNIVDFRTENGAFTSRNQLKKVPRMGAKAFEQCAGFLRVAGGDNPLDNSAVHPESYYIVEEMAKKSGCKIKDIIGDAKVHEKIKAEEFVNTKTGLLTINDILTELEKPGRDPRGAAETFSFDETIKTIDDLHEGIILPGIVNNITNFGCFVDIGIKENGLVHLSQLSDKYVSSPSEVVKLHQKVQVRVTEIDKARKRVGLAMKGVPQK